jgi:hypothetical protein
MEMAWRHNYATALCLGTIVLCGRAAGAAETMMPARPTAYALLVGSNQGGSGQEALRFANEDARRMFDVLTEAGDYRPENVALVLSSRRSDLVHALENVTARLIEENKKGKKTLFLFYYSGHARANALNLGEEELPLTELRERLEQVPAAVTVAVLDACQSGAISHIKGSEASADFSYDSVARFTTSGIALMASSAASELSQESEDLHSSYFTHHLAVALRGAGDADRDGQVTLGEAYHYAYHHTLLDTAITKVGSQHVTLETDLKGKGEVVLSYPAQAHAQLELPAPLAAQILIERKPSGTVLAELHKAAGESVRLALPAGQYRALVRLRGAVRQCRLALADAQVTNLAIEQCEKSDERLIAAKGGAPLREKWAIELGMGGGSHNSDRYIQRIKDFGYGDSSLDWVLPQFRYELSLSRTLTRMLAIVGTFASGDTGQYTRWDSPTLSQEFSWHAFALGAHLRVSYPLGEDRVITVVPYAQGGGGLSIAGTKFALTNNGTTTNTTTTYVGYQLAVAAGLQFLTHKHVGCYLQGRYMTVPVVKNLLGDTHDSGGFDLVLGMRGYW